MIAYIRNENVTPDEAIKELMRLTAKYPVHISISGTIDMPASATTAFPYPASIEVTKKQMLKLLADLKRFHAAKLEQNQHALVAMRVFKGEYNERQHFFAIG